MNTDKPDWMQSRANVRRDAMEAWEAHESDRRHATGKDVDAWLAKLEPGEDVPPPDCHG